MSLPAEHPPPDLLTTAEAATLLRVSPITIARWAKQGRLPSYRLGPRAVRFRRADLDAMLRPPTVDEESPHEPSPPPYRPYRHDPSVINHELLASIKPPTEEEIRAGLAAMEAASQLRAQMRARRGGVPVPDSWPLIREARDER